MGLQPGVQARNQKKGRKGHQGFIITLRVLLLEDSPLDADLVIDWLSGDGFECIVTHVQGRAEFAVALGSDEYDIILSDYSLPGFDGIEALEMSQQARPSLPFLFVSGYLGEELAIETLKRGATDYVLKGRLERLAPAVQRALREARERRDRERFEATLRILAEASLALSSLDYTATLSHIARLAVPHFADYCVVDVVKTDGSVERVATAHSDPGKEALTRRLMEFGPPQSSQHPIWQVLEEGRSQLGTQESGMHMSRLIRDGEHAEVVQQLGLSSFMMVPLLTGDKPLGVMTFALASPARSYDERDIAMAEDLARRCALAVENARLHQQTLEALRARDEFLAVLSHELRSPLGAILGWTHLLQGEGADSQLLAHGLTVIERNTRAQVQLVQDLLEVSRIITGRLHLEMVPVVLGEVVESVLLSMEPTSEAKGIQASFSNAAPGLQVLGDAARLQQVIWNLVSNAVKFTPQGGRVDVVLGSDGAVATVTVRDSGEGIGKEFLPYVFDRFRQADSSSTRSHGGLGLGLAIVRHLSEMHGGSVHAASDGPGQGATFTVRLPVRPTTAEQGDDAPSSAQASNSESAPGAGMLSGRKILLVEDGDDAREILAAILRRAGAEVAAASSSQSAMQMLEATTPDLLLSDIGMPDEDGYALLGRVQEWSRQRGLRIPAIALTAYAAEQDKQRAREAGFCLHLAKPVSPARLIEAVAEVLSSPC